MASKIRGRFVGSSIVSSDYLDDVMRGRSMQRMRLNLSALNYVMMRSGCAPCVANQSFGKIGMAV